jgi:hypothetical protein
MLHLRFFLSSPGDVPDERTFAQQVIEQELPKDPLLRGALACEVARWDDPNAPVGMPANLTPQEAVNRGMPKPSECDVVIVILWARMGTPLPDTYRKPDGTTYLSGTEYEYEEAAAASHPPSILIFRRTSEVAINPDAADADDRLEQRRRVRRFFDRFRNPDGSWRGGVNEYDSPQAFRDRLRSMLRAYVQRRLAEQEQEAPRAAIRALPPLGEIGRALLRGRVVPFIGAGAACAGRPQGARWDPAQALFLPSGGELSRFLAADAAFPEHEACDDLAKVASCYEAFAGRPTLRERLRGILVPGAGAGMAVPPLYGLLASVPVPLLLVTTNIDVQLELALRQAGRPYDLVVYPADRKDLANAVLWWRHGEALPQTPAPNELDIDLATTTVIFKMHGSVQPDTDEWDSFVITEEDHVEFLSRLGAKSAVPSLFFAHLSERSLLFLGCSLHDWNLRIVLRTLSRYLTRRAGDEEEVPSWAINDELSELEARLWQRRGVYPFRLDLDDFAAGLRQRLRT